MSFRVFAAFVVIAGLAAGCDGGVDCPLERPSCCDNQLFGCGPFDLRQGCSCDDYLARSFQGVVIHGARGMPRSRRYTAQGTWRVSMQKTTAGCVHLPAQIQKTLLARDKNGRVEFKLLGYTTLRGVRLRREVRVRGEYRILLPRCMAETQVRMSLSDYRSATATSVLRIRCSQEALSCDVTYSGIARRVS